MVIKVPKTCYFDCVNIIEAVNAKQGSARASAEVSAIQYLMRTLPAGGTWMVKNAYSNNVHRLFSQEQIEYELSAEILRAQKNNNISKIRSIVHLYDRHNINDVEFDIDPGHYVDEEGFDEENYTDLVLTSNLAVKTFKKIRMVLQKWNLVRQQVISIQKQRICKKKIALMIMGRNPIINNYLLRKVFVPRFETFGLHKVLLDSHSELKGYMIQNDNSCVHAMIGFA
tara:strand:- start:320 stop:1000 length:681 start_codon:yes stop_codon:yes gene_type:complete